VLAFLLLREGHPAAAEEIIESLWGEDAPRSVNGVLRTYVHRLRRLFPTGPHANPLIQSIAGSYLLPAPAGRHAHRTVAAERAGHGLGRAGTFPGDPPRLLE
jgi:DNA-binding SARP family transcriptional activator